MFLDHIAIIGLCLKKKTHSRYAELPKFSNAGQQKFTPDGLNNFVDFKPKPANNKMLLFNVAKRQCSGVLFKVVRGFVERFRIPKKRGWKRGEPVEMWTERSIIYEVVNHVNGIQRPMVQAADEHGRLRVQDS